uniref:Uncharacterized protein n=1 Tax=Eucampia antarctica TaxID=49252 RepID=A0A7S2RQ91_9STRA|mmetsp:Transcript_24853/g.23877  ORF Transcript_24853/g.23877 Transcript_24853/m.23877 type:complete len:126 (+) Transcript_24853:86-463(+)
MRCCRLSPLFSLALFIMLNIATVQSFTVQSKPSALKSYQRSKNVMLSLKENDEVEDPVKCYVVEDSNVAIDGSVVCTSEPEEFAFHEGIKSTSLKPTDGMNEGNTECVESASPKGNPEWLCTDET